MEKNINEIMDMLDWNNSPEIQAEGRRLGAAIDFSGYEQLRWGIFSLCCISFVPLFLMLLWYISQGFKCVYLDSNIDSYWFISI